jgi:hypothetical protein
MLDEVRASDIEIVNQDSFVAVSWRDEGLTSDKRSYREPQLATLRAQAQFLRGGGVPGATSVESLTELLRPLGQELDDAGIEMVAINQVPGGFRVSGIRAGVYQSHTVYLADLREASARHRLKRGTGGGRRPHEIDPFLGVQRGMPISTRENTVIGKVGDVQGRSFLVKTPLLQRDFWLLGSLVTEANPNRGVRLSLYKAELERHKQAKPVEDDTTVFHPLEPRG